MIPIKKVLDQYGCVELIDYMGDDQAVCHAARVLPFAEDRGEKDVKLIKYLMDNKHSTPFEHVTFKFRVNAPIAFIRHWQRHRTWSYNEESARYKSMQLNYYVPATENIGVQSDKTHQSREEKDNPNAAEIRMVMDSCMADTLHKYQKLIELGCPRELARGVMPVFAYSEMIATVNLWNLIHFVRVRRDHHAQWEMRQYSEAIIELIRDIVPVSLQAAGLIDGEKESAD